jgi:hypothetical protein
MQVNQDTRWKENVLFWNKIPKFGKNQSVLWIIRL